MGLEIERKYLVKELPQGLDGYPFHTIEQGYLNVYPAIRVRREDDIYYMTYKSDNKEADAGDIGKTEYNMPLDAASYEHMVSKADGNMIRKTRYLIPLNEDAFTQEYLKINTGLAGLIENGNILIELDVFKAPFEGRMIAEVEFPDEESARNYRPAVWFGEEVTGDHRYSNAYMSKERV